MVAAIEEQIVTRVGKVFVKGRGKVENYLNLVFFKGNFSNLVFSPNIVQLKMLFYTGSA